jgi:hypothetical protein
MGCVDTLAAKSLGRQVRGPAGPCTGAVGTISTAGYWYRVRTRTLCSYVDCRDMLDWRPSSEIGRVPIYQINGTNDRVFPARLAAPDELVSGAGPPQRTRH